MDYREYVLSKVEKGRIILYSLGLTIGIAFLFYRSMWGMCCFPFLYFLFYKREKENGKEKRDQQLLDEFVNGIRVLNTSLQAGISMENAWREVQKEVQMMYGEESLFFKEIKEMNQENVIILVNIAEIQVWLRLFLLHHMETNIIRQPNVAD